LIAGNQTPVREGAHVRRGAQRRIAAQAYGKWSETLGGSADHWLEICAEKIAFGSLANGPPGSTYLTASKLATTSRAISPGSRNTGR